MLTLRPDGSIGHPKIRVRLFHSIEREPLSAIHGIVVHQTASPTAKATFASYTQSRANGAHFLIDKDGTIYQTASLFKRTWHVGKIRSRCFQRHSCNAIDLMHLQAAMRIRNPRIAATAVDKLEMMKPVLDRYPSNADSVGIEIVGAAIGPVRKEVFEPVNTDQNLSLRWLIYELKWTFEGPLMDVYRHPAVSQKNETEASTAVWE